MQIISLNPTTPPVINFICRKARVSEATARVIAGLNGNALPDEWECLSAPVARVVASLARRGRA